MKSNIFYCLLFSSTSFFLNQKIHAQAHEFKCSMYGYVTVNGKGCSDIGITINLDPKAAEPVTKQYHTAKDGFYCVETPISEGQLICYTLNFNDIKAPSGCFSYSSEKWKSRDFDTNSSFFKGKGYDCNFVRPLEKQRPAIGR